LSLKVASKKQINRGQVPNYYGNIQVKMKLKKGALIVLDGIDGTGKTTQAKRLLATLQKRGMDAVYFREPSDSQYGVAIKKKATIAGSLTPEEELDLFQKDRKENVEHNLKPALRQNKVIVLDRYYFSTIAYQGARGFDAESIRHQNESFAVLPDVVFILDITPKKGLDRISIGRGKMESHFEREDYLLKVREIFRSFEGDNIHHIDASRPEEEIYKDIERIVLDFLCKIKSVCSHKEVKGAEEEGIQKRAGMVPRRGERAEE
jgi:dTMP kinase